MICQTIKINNIERALGVSFGDDKIFPLRLFSLINNIMKKIEYEIRNEMDKISFDQLNRYGQEGWELCGIIEDGYYIIYYFKREITKE